ncbi:MAG TPA: AAA family ATPase [Verrucomicrobiae bacterium]|nr:AAA family ATPase [Verrucomicrobiae bacterium]
MFTRIQTRSFRCLKSVDQTLGSFRALVGPNASGKTTFLDVIGFLGDLVRNRGDVLETVQTRSSSFEKLVWMGQGNAFQIAVEAEIPEAMRKVMAEDKQRFTRVRYEVEVGLEMNSNEIGLDQETLWLKEAEAEKKFTQRVLFPAPQANSPSLISHSQKGQRVALTKTPGGNDNYYTEGRKSYMPSFKLGRGKSALANIPADMESFPVSTWFRNLLEKGVQPFVLNSQLMRQPSPPGLGRRFQTDGSNLPWVVEELRQDQKRYHAWLEHVRTALEDIKDVASVERSEDRHRYLVIEYMNGAKVPSWLASDGTLRLLTLTIPAYLSDIAGTFLIEEPENGIHPRAIETVLQSLSSIYRSQVLLATHSPVALNMLEPRDVLCFAKDANGATDIVSGDRHPALVEWKKGEPDLGVLFASGILS